MTLKMPSPLWGLSLHVRLKASYAGGTLSVKDSGGKEQFEPSFWSGSGFIEEYLSRRNTKNIVFS